MSTAIDQRLNVWEVCEEDGLKRVSSDTHDVADPSSLAVFNTKYTVLFQDCIVFLSISIQAKWCSGSRVRSGATILHVLTLNYTFMSKLCTTVME